MAAAQAADPAPGAADPAATGASAAPADEAAPAAEGAVAGSASVGASAEAAAPAVAAPAAPAPVEAAPAAPEVAPGPRPPALDPIKIETPNAVLKFGVLFQPQFEAAGSPALDSTTLNLFVRRTRVLLGLSMFKTFDFFFDTEFADLFKTDATGAGARNTNGLNIQDAFGTAKIAGDALKLDVGYMLPPTSHNGLQSAGSLYGWDYFSNTFRHNTALNGVNNAGAAPVANGGNPVGRDAGVQLRGLLLDGHLEYRAGVFQGLRVAQNADDVQGRRFFRTAGRLQINFLDAETGFFYGGTYLGAKRILSVGGGVDFQQGYRHASGDLFVDLPAGPGVFTTQVNFGHWNGSTTAPLPVQSAIMAEAGYLINAINLSPIVRFEKRWVKGETAGVPDETRFSGGLAFWPYGHNINLKAFVTSVDPDPSAHAFLQFNLQAQLFVY